MCHTRAKKIFDQCIGIYKLSCIPMKSFTQMSLVHFLSHPFLTTHKLWCKFWCNYGLRDWGIKPGLPAPCTNRKALTVHCDSSRQKGDKDKPNILVSFVSNIAALRLMWHHNFSLSNFEEMMAFKKLFLVYKVHFFSFEQDLLYKETKKGKVMMLCITLQPCQSWQKIM